MSFIPYLWEKCAGPGQSPVLSLPQSSRVAGLYRIRIQLYETSGSDSILISSVSVPYSLYPDPAQNVKYLRLDPYSEYESGSIRPLNTDPIPKISVADPEGFITDPAFNLPSSGSGSRQKFRIQPN